MIKLAKHVHDGTFQCWQCRGPVVGRGFTLLSSHHFPWGIEYACDCGKQRFKSNFIRSYEEFKTMVLGDQHWTSFWSGFCNDRYCSQCRNWIEVISNHMGTDAQGGMYVSGGGKIYKIIDYPAFMQLYKREHVTDDMLAYLRPMGRKLDTLNGFRFIDMMGCPVCAGRGINDGLIHSGSEYGEGEYAGLYAWCREHVGNIPDGLRKELELVGKEPPQKEA